LCNFDKQTFRKRETVYQFVKWSPARHARHAAIAAAWKNRRVAQGRAARTGHGQNRLETAGGQLVFTHCCDHHRPDDAGNRPGGEQAAVDGTDHGAEHFLEHRAGHRDHGDAGCDVQAPAMKFNELAKGDQFCFFRRGTLLTKTGTTTFASEQMRGLEAEPDADVLPEVADAAPAATPPAAPADPFGASNRVDFRQGYVQLDRSSAWANSRRFWQP
jgi:hypothetical protein